MCARVAARALRSLFRWSGRPGTARARTRARLGLSTRLTERFRLKARPRNRSGAKPTNPPGIWVEKRGGRKIATTARGRSVAGSFRGLAGVRAGSTRHRGRKTWVNDKRAYAVSRGCNGPRTPDSAAALASAHAMKDRALKRLSLCQWVGGLNRHAQRAAHWRDRYAAWAAQVCTLAASRG